MGYEKIFDILNWIKDKLPFQNKNERIKNAIFNLETERTELLRGTADVKKVRRITAIDSELKRLREQLKNAAPSS